VHWFRLFKIYLFETWFFTFYFQEPSATAEYDPDTLSQLTPMSDKSQGKVTNDASADKFTPLKMPETVVLPTTATYEEIIPAKQSSSKRVKVIKTEKK
jgi:hypothetical protein